MRDDTKDHSRDPRLIDLCAAVLLLALVVLVLTLINRGTVIEPTQSIGVDRYVRW
jgi:hypothetical protein